MAEKEFVVEGRQFRTESDYARAVRDKEIVDRLRAQTDFGDREALERLLGELRTGRYPLRTLLGQDFKDEVVAALRKADRDRRENPGKQAGQVPFGLKRAGGAGKASSGRGKSAGKASSGWERSAGKMPSGQERLSGSGKASSGSGRPQEEDSAGMEEIVEQELRKREKRRRLVLLLCSIVAVCCLGYFSAYSYYAYRTRNVYEELSALKEKPAAASQPSATPAPTPAASPLFTLDAEAEPKEVLEEYKNLLLKNRKLIGWVKIDGTNIDYPVMQTTDNEYYLDHNIQQEYDKNGAIFMDKDCDVLKPSTNYILYGHYMSNGLMFAQLKRYNGKSFFEKHPYISFDTIYEKGTYQVMYVFRSRVYKETEIVFKYYQFIDANGEQEFDSYMKEMAALSLYDTGVSAVYGDQLLTLSTCDYQEKDGRFVVVAKKVPEGQE